MRGGREKGRRVGGIEKEGEELEGERKREKSWRERERGRRVGGIEKEKAEERMEV